MKCQRSVVLVTLAALCFVPAAARAQSAAPDSVLYALVSPPSEFEWGCFAPCMCPVLVQSPLTGGFILRLSSVGPLFTTYDVLDVLWKTPTATGTTTITGSGTYTLGGEVALTQELTLDLSFDGGQSQHFDSGLQPPGATFPAISSTVSLHGEYCHDSVLVVAAKPLGLSGVGGQPSRAMLTVAPNPFSTVTRITFALPSDGVVDVAVFDLAGRQVRSLAPRAWAAAGQRSYTWDGRLDDGARAAPGLYMVRLRTVSGSMSRLVVRLR